MKRILILLSGIFFVCLPDMQAQDTVHYKVPYTFSFIKNENNQIHNPEALDTFFAKLVALKTNKNGVVNILHIGDSHIQADYLTGTTRTLLQKEFGNAGLGLTFPGRAARTNESPAIYSSATGVWENNRISLSQNTLPTGIGGITLKTEQAGNALTIKTTLKDHSFNRITLFFQKDFQSYNLIVKDSTGMPLAMAGSFTEEAHSNASRLVFPYALNQVHLETVQSLPIQNHFTFFGISLENSNPGVRHHIIGVNGAKFKHYISSKELLQQVPVLNPDLIIISLGTNEAADHPNIDPKLGSQVNTLVFELNKMNPHAIILLTTAPDSYIKKTRRNPGVQLINTKIIEIANNNNLPYWNLFEAAGGNHSADQWKRKELLQNDGIHFTKKGYDLQGHLLFEAIIKGYNEYVQHRHSKTH